MVAAARVVGAPAVSDRHAGVGHVVDLVMGHVAARDVGGQNRDDAAVVQAEVMDPVVADGDVPVDHPLIAGVVRVGADTADHDAAGRAVSDLRPGHRDVGGAQPTPLAWALASLPIPMAVWPRLTNRESVKVMFLAAETCTAAGIWYQFGLVASNCGQPSWQEFGRSPGQFQLPAM